MKVRKYNAVRNVLVFSLVFVMTLSSVSITSFANEMLLSEADTKTEMSSSEVLGGNQNFLFDTMSKVAAIGDTIELKYVPYNENLKDVVITFPENVSYVEGNWDNSQVEKQQNDVVISQEQPIASESSVPQEPTATTEPTDSQEPTATAEPTDSQEPTATLEPTESQEPTATIEPTVLQEPTATLEPTATIEPTVLQEPTATLEPTDSQEPTATLEPSYSQEPTATLEPSYSQEPTATTKPTDSQEPTATLEPTESQQPLTTYAQTLNQSQQAPTDEAFEAIVVDGKNVTIHNNVNKVGSVIVLKFNLENANITKFELNAKLNDEVLTASTQVFMARVARAGSSPVALNTFDFTVATGTPGFQNAPSGYQQNDKPIDGDDYNETDDYVRSNDIILYNAKLSVAPLDINDKTQYKNIVVRIEAKLGNAVENKFLHAKFSNPFVSSIFNGDENTAYTDVTFKAMSEVVEVPLTLQIYAAKNGATFKPTFKATIISVEGTSYPTAETHMVKSYNDVKTVNTSSRINLDAKVVAANANGIPYSGVFKSDYPGLSNDARFVQFGVALKMIPLSDNGNSRTDMKGVMAPTEPIDVKLESYLKVGPIYSSSVPNVDVHTKADAIKTRLVAYNYVSGDYSNYKDVEPLAPDFYNVSSRVNFGIPGSYDERNNGYGGSRNADKVYNSGILSGYNNSSLDDSKASVQSNQQHTIGFDKYVINDHFPTIWNGGTYDEIMLNNSRYFASASVMFYVPTKEFTEAGDLDAVLTSTLKAPTIIYHAKDGDITYNSLANSMFQIINYPRGEMGVYTHAVEFLTEMGLDKEPVSVAPTGNGTIAYGGRFRVYTYSLLASNAAIANGGLEVLQKWDPNKTRVDGYGGYTVGRMPTAPDTSKIKRYYGVMKTDIDPSNPDSTTEIADRRRIDYVWYPATDLSNIPAVKDGKQVSAFLVEDFNIILPDTQTRLLLKYRADRLEPNAQTGKYNDDTAPFLSYSTYFKKTRDLNDYNDINDIVNDPFPISKGKMFDSKGNLLNPDHAKLYLASKIANGNYTKRVYDNDGYVTSAGHEPNGTFGDTVLIVPYAVSISKNVTNKATGSTVPGSKTSFYANETINWKLSPEFTTTIPNSTLPKDYVTITDTLPQGLEYIDGTSKQDGNPDLVTEYNATTRVLTWKLFITPGEAIVPITYDTTTGFDIKLTNNGGTSADLINSVVVSTRLDKSIARVRTATKTVTITQLRGVGVGKKVNKDKVEVGEDFTYDLNVYSTTSDAQSNIRVLDILPYNGDGRGSHFDGNYKLKNISFANGAKNPNIYYTNMPVGNIPNDPKDINTTDGWNSYANDSKQLVDATAVLIVYPQSITSTDVLSHVSVTIKPNGNKPENVYSNQAINNSSMDLVLKSQVVTTTVVNRTISGLAWLDENRDGKRDANETIFQNVPVALFTKSGSTYTKVTKDVTGADFTTTKTDGAGKYEFTNLANAIYYVGFGVDTDTYTISPTKKASVATDLNSDISQTEKTPIVARTAANYYLSVDNYPFKAPSAMTTFAESYKNIDAGMYVTPLPGKVVIKKLEKTLFNPVANVKFNIYDWDEKETDVSKITAQTPVNATPIETNADGTVNYTFDTEKSYLVYESGVPEGYIGAKPAYFTLTVKSDGNVVFGSLKNDAVYSTDKPTMGGIVSLYIVN